MNRIRERCDDRGPLLGLLVGGMVCLLAQLLPYFTHPSETQAPSSHPPATPCMYEIYEGTSCLGTVSSDRPLALQDILRMMGRPGAQGRFADLDRCVPCGSCINTKRHSTELMVRPIPGAKLMAAGRKIDLNRAAASDLACLPGIGPKTAETIVQARSNRNGFTSIDELKTIGGIGEKKWQVLAQWLEIGPWPGNMHSADDRAPGK